MPVGSYPEGASWVGALNMAGNVWEWVNDWYDSDYYANSPADDPGGPYSGSSKVLRGGGWNLSPINLRGSQRLHYVPGLSLGSFGFRCVFPGG